MNDKIGRFGILTCNLIDSLSVLIDKISISHNNKYNTVGLYYINDDNDYSIILFDLHDSFNITWTTSHRILSQFISSPYVADINFYFLDEDNINNFSPIYTTTILKINNNNRSKLEEKFINIISGLLISCNYERNYNNYVISIVNNKKLGNELINKILLLLITNYDNSKHFSESMKNTFSLTIKKITSYIKIIDDDFENVIDNEIVKFKESFLKICTTNDFFSNVDISIFDKKTTAANNESNDIDPECISVKYNDIKNLGYWLNQTIISNNKLEQNLSIKNVITIYNNLDLNLDPINNDINIILNPDIICSLSSIEDIMLIIKSNIISQNKTDMSILSYKKLFDILIYIDSLRDSSGFFDNRFSGIQNLISKELSYRTKLKEFS